MILCALFICIALYILYMSITVQLQCLPMELCIYMCFYAHACVPYVKFPIALLNFNTINTL